MVTNVAFQIVRSNRSSRSFDLYPFGYTRSVVRPIHIRSDAVVRLKSFVRVVRSFVRPHSFNLVEPFGSFGRSFGWFLSPGSAFLGVGSFVRSSGVGRFYPDSLDRSPGSPVVRGRPILPGSPACKPRSLDRSPAVILRTTTTTDDRTTASQTAAPIRTTNHDRTTDPTNHTKTSPKRAKYYKLI